ncbi:MAG: asparagine--tRNA ligase [Candidatus Pacearchaeota archaeon]|jgi:asparaginyl-tRNA synthetase
MTKFIPIKSAMKQGKGKVAVRGWIYRERGSNKMKFLVLRDSSDIIQCVLNRENFEKQWDEIDKLKIESSVEIEGTIKEDKRAPTGFEINVEKINIIHIAEDYPINKDLNEELLGDRRHLWLRSRKMIAIMKIRSTVFGAIHEYFRENDFYEYQSPIFQAVQCEGGSSLFNVDYFGKKGVFLAQTWQLYAEPAIFALEKIYTIAPSFRAEESKTSRHLTEYWHAEMEVAWASFKDIQDYGEGLIKHIMKKVLEKNKEELEILERDIKKLEPVLKKKFPRITYDDALKILKDKAKIKIPWGKDLRTIEEDVLSKLYDTPVIVTNYPKEVKAFYMKETEGNPKVVNGCDFIAPEGYGEIIGGSEREADINKIKKRLIEMKENPEQYSFYLDTRRYGSVPHGGFGMGVERIISWICGLTTIKDAIPFPRTMTRWTP